MTRELNNPIKLLLLSVVAVAVSGIVVVVLMNVVHYQRYCYVPNQRRDKNAIKKNAFKRQKRNERKKKRKVNTRCRLRAAAQVDS